MIIYIDDLDRCSPRHAVEILETINLFLDTDRCIFVLGMDHDLVADAVDIKYAEMSKKFNANSTSPRRYGDQFLEKLIQVPIAIPSMSDEELNRYVSTDVAKIKSEEPATTAPRTDIDNPLSTEPVSELDIPISDGIKKTFQSLLPYLDRSPRSIKRFYNMLSIVHFFYISNRESLGAVDDVSLTMWFFLEYRFSEEAKRLQEPGHEELTFADLAAGERADLSMIMDFFNSYMASGESSTAVIGRIATMPIAPNIPITRFFAT